MAVRLVAVLMTFAMGCGSLANNAGASPSAGTPVPAASAPTAAATATPSPTPTRKPNPIAGPGVYTSVAYAYRMSIPAGWRRSACQSTRDPTGPPGVETFTDASVEAESGTDTGPANDVVSVRIEEDPTGQSALAWLESGKMGFSTGSRFEKVTFDGIADAARIMTNDGATALAYVVHARGSIYALDRGLRDPSSTVEAAARGLMLSFHVLTDAELADARAGLEVPAVPPARTAEEVADTLGRGYGARDASVLATVASACLSGGAENAGVAFYSSAKWLTDTQKAFANGFVAVVEPRPIEFSPGPQPTGATIRAIWKDPGQPQRNAKLMMQRVGSTWYWIGVLFLQP